MFTTPTIEEGENFGSYAELGCYYLSQINTLIRVEDPKLLLKLAKYDQTINLYLQPPWTW